jgi:hypothetical protein
MNIDRFASQLRALGINLSVTPAGGLSASGSETVIKMLMPTLKTHKVVIIEALNSGRMHGDLVHRDWRITYPNRDTDYTTSPAIDADELLAWHPGAITAEISTSQPQTPSKPLTDQEVRALTQWLQRGGETDVEAIGGVIDQCNQDRIQRNAWLGWVNDRKYQCKGFTANES